MTGPGGAAMKERKAERVWLMPFHAGYSAYHSSRGSAQGKLFLSAFDNSTTLDVIHRC